VCILICLQQLYELIWHCCEFDQVQGELLLYKLHFELKARGESSIPLQISARLEEYSQLNLLFSAASQNAHNLPQQAGALNLALHKSTQAVILPLGDSLHTLTEISADFRS